jgi:hypothetical protein
MKPIFLKHHFKNQGREESEEEILGNLLAILKML